jgi:DNA-binding MarR family transcriptional regulator
MIQTDHFFLLLAELLQRAATRTGAAWAPASARLGLTRLQTSVLTAVQHNPGCTMGNLSRDSSLLPPAATRLVDELVSESLVERFADSEDRRIIRLQLTIRGRYIADNIQRDATGRLSKILTVMSVEEIETLQRGLEKLIQAISTTNEGN